MPRVSLLAVSALVSLMACAGTAHAATRSYGVTSFDHLRIAGPFDVHAHVGGAPGAQATGPQDAIDRLSVEQQGDTLVIQPLSSGWGGWPSGFHGKLVVDVGALSLSNVAVTGSGDVTVDRARGDQLDLALSGSGNLSVAGVDVARLTAVITGSGNLILAGRALQAKATLTGSGNLKADQLASEDGEANLVGSGDLSLGARHAAKVNLAGSGNITITGPAACSVQRTGSGDVHCDR